MPVMQAEQMSIFETMATSEEVAENLKDFKLLSAEIVTPFPIGDFKEIVMNLNEYKKTKEIPKAFKKLGQGYFGIVFAYKNYAVKYVKGGADSYSDYNNQKNIKELADATVLKRIHHLECVPTLYAVIDNNTVIMEKIDGMTIQEYREQMLDIDKLDNFICDDFVELHSDYMKDILLCGMIPNDLHSSNVMVERITGKPKIIDVGLFKNIDKTDSDYAYIGNSRETVISTKFYDVTDALRTAEKMIEFQNEKLFPELLKRRVKRLKIEREENQKLRTIEFSKKMEKFKGKAEEKIVELKSKHKRKADSNDEKITYETVKVSQVFEAKLVEPKLAINANQLINNELNKSNKPLYFRVKF